MNIAISDIQLYDLIKSKLGEREAQSLVSFVKQEIQAELAAKGEVLVTKEDLANAKAEMIKWMFIFWISQVVTTFGFILLYLKK